MVPDAPLRSHGPVRPSLLLAAAVLAAGTARAGDGLERYRSVDTARVRTSVYVARVTLNAPHFVRTGDTYVSSYEVTVFPYSFLDERGRIEISVPDRVLREFAAGRPFDFTGRAVRSDGKVRRVEGHVVPAGPSEGRIRVRVRVTRHIPLDFETTYTLTGS
jgi:hypothetical protein